LPPPVIGASFFAIPVFGISSRSKRLVFFFFPPLFLSSLLNCPDDKISLPPRTEDALWGPLQIVPITLSSLAATVYSLNPLIVSLDVFILCDIFISSTPVIALEDGCYSLLFPCSPFFFQSQSPAELDLPIHPPSPLSFGPPSPKGKIQSHLRLFTVLLDPDL